MAITSQVIKEVVAAHDDFGHEMRVRDIIRSVPNAESTHGGTYLDLVTGKPRQYDFRCVLRRDVECLQFAVECKNLSADSPVVICGTNLSTEEAFHEIIESKYGLFTEMDPGTQSVRSIMDGLDSITRRVKNSNIYRRGEFGGKNIIKLKPSKNGKGEVTGYTTEPDTDVYTRWTQALSSAHDMCKAATEYARDFGKRQFFTATIPVVVVSDESLWTVNYDDDGVVRSEPSRSDHCPFFVDRRIMVTVCGRDKRFSLSHIHFCTLSGLKSWMTSIQNNNDAWSQWFPPASLAK